MGGYLPMEICIPKISVFRFGQDTVSENVLVHTRIGHGKTFSK